MATILGLAVSNWLIWASMVLFILAYFVYTERINRRDEAPGQEEE